jgi:hypothetical protein
MLTRLQRWACRTGSPVMRFSVWVGGLPTYVTHHPTRAARICSSGSAEQMFGEKQQIQLAG